MECPDKKKDFRTEAAKLGVDVHAKPNEFWTPEGTPVFMVAGSGPFVGSVDYLYLLNRHRELRAALSALAQEQAPMKAKGKDSLLPCPFCTGAVRLTVVRGTYENPTGFQVACENERCLVNPFTPMAADQSLVRNSWNNRPPGAQVAALPDPPDDDVCYCEDFPNPKCRVCFPMDLPERPKA